MIEYIKQHEEDIRNHQHNPINWWINNNGELHAGVKKALQKGALTGITLNPQTNYPEGISREDVIKYFQQDLLYLGFIAAMLWGKTRQLETIVDIPHKKIEEKLIRVKDKLIKGEITDAFISMSEVNSNDEGDSNKIDGVGPAFFTKIFYFMSKAFAPMEKPIPLILDSHMMYIHCALLIDYDEDVKEYYKWHVDKKGNAGITWSHTSPKFKSEVVYWDYINRMHNISFNEGYPADKLEEYLFDTIPLSPGYEIYEEVKKRLINATTPITVEKDNNSSISQANSTLITHEIHSIYRMKEGHEVLEEEALNINGSSVVLILARTKNGSHFCGFWNKNVPNTNFDLIPEIQDIITKLSLSSLKWQNKPEYSRKYVMFRKKDSIKAKELKDKISEFIHNMAK